MGIKFSHEWCFFQSFWYFTKKKAEFRGIFRGKFAQKSVDFVGFSWEKSQNSWKNRPISRDFRGRKIKIRGKIGRFRGRKVKIRRQIGQFHGLYRKKSKFRRKTRPISREIFGGKLRQETISKKQPISLGFFWQISLKSINFASIWPVLFNVFFNRDNHLLFQRQFAWEMSEC